SIGLQGHRPAETDSQQDPPDGVPRLPRQDQDPRDGECSRREGEQRFPRAYAWVPGACLRGKGEGDVGDDENRPQDEQGPGEPTSTPLAHTSGSITLGLRITPPLRAGREPPGPTARLWPRILLHRM